MAEFVNQRIEDMMSELEQMKRIELYSAEEIREISKKRTDFEYKIHRQTKSKEDYLRYIAYECILLQDIKLRRKALSMNEKKADIEYALSKRVRKLYKELVQRFPSDLEIWLNYIIFCKNVNFSPCITAIFEELLQVHGDKARVWQLACRWEFEEMHSIDTARKFAVKGLQRHPTSEELYIDTFRMELTAAKDLDEDQRATQLERATIFLKSALKHVPEVSLLVELCSIANSFDFAESLQAKLFSELWNKHSDKQEAWDFVAKCEFEGKSVGDFDWKSLKENFFLTRCPEDLAKFFNVYETSVAKVYLYFIDNPYIVGALAKTDMCILRICWEKVPHADACNGYIKNAIKLITADSDNTVVKLHILKRALSKGHMLAQLTEQQYRLWLDLLCCDEETSEDEITKMLKEACENLPTSEYLWEERLKRNKSNANELIKIFKQAEAALPTEKGTMLWIILLENTKDLNKLKKLHEESLRLSVNVARKLKPIFLRSFYESGGISAAREEYAAMVKTPPFEMNLHKTMLELEGCQKIPNYKQMKNCHEVATQQFGKKDPEVWINFIKFETNNGHPERCGPLYNRACASLDRDSVDKFIVMYSLNKN